MTLVTCKFCGGPTFQLTVQGKYGDAYACTACGRVTTILKPLKKEQWV